ncbi:uncharacterized protein EHS24_003058 [Apiotrichum porosum]|uniref:Uncharacterized protein n=1 Tax=Apiotrichum porosum TaxID=105984 RepID=A0A427XF59_9TREE|nr:uncharacterized protein EHS24_003058 [Apiotrichum porosum]RSH77505.1 hypothetical protein EHS24_003058 [Apiotrichum porosum]
MRGLPIHDNLENVAATAGASAASPLLGKVAGDVEGLAGLPSQCVLVSATISFFVLLAAAITLGTQYGFCSVAFAVPFSVWVAVLVLVTVRYGKVALEAYRARRVAGFASAVASGAL